MLLAILSWVPYTLTDYLNHTPKLVRTKQMTTNILLCSDLDRTILPNGHQEESPAARPLLRTVARWPDVTIAYVSGRHRELLLEAIHEYDIPMPNYAICDVGTTWPRTRTPEPKTWITISASSSLPSRTVGPLSAGTLRGLFRADAGQRPGAHGRGLARP